MDNKGKKKRIRLLFRSGQAVDVTVEKLTVTRNGSRITQLEWTDMEPRPLHLNIDQLDALFEL